MFIREANPYIEVIIDWCVAGWAKIGDTEGGVGDNGGQGGGAS